LIRGLSIAACAAVATAALIAAPAVKAAPWQGVSVYLNGTAGNAKYSSNNLWAAGVPSDTESIGLTYANRNWNAGIFSKRVGRTYNDNGAVNQASPNDPWNMTNVFVNYTLGNRGASIARS
jgi:hypothetical protein